MNRQIYILEGSYRSKKIENEVFEMIKPYHPYPHKQGGFVTVKIKDLKDKRLNEKTRIILKKLKERLQN
jgi:hypothetical protein